MLTGFQILLGLCCSTHSWKIDSIIDSEFIHEVRAMYIAHDVEPAPLVGKRYVVVRPIFL